MMRRSKLEMDDITVSVVNWSDRQAELISVRRAVFIEEQNVPESIEIDGKDPDCFHVLACDKSGNPIGTAWAGSAHPTDWIYWEMTAYTPVVCPHIKYPIAIPATIARTLSSIILTKLPFMVFFTSS